MDQASGYHDVFRHGSTEPLRSFLRREQKVPLGCIHDHEQLSEFGFFHQAARSYHVDRIPTQNQLLASS